MILRVTSLQVCGIVKLCPLPAEPPSVVGRGQSWPSRGALSDTDVAPTRDRQALEDIREIYSHGHGKMTDEKSMGLGPWGIFCAASTLSLPPRSPSLPLSLVSYPELLL